MFNTDQKRAFIAVLLSGLVLFGWQYYFAPKTPLVSTAPVVTASQTTVDLTAKPPSSDATLNTGAATTETVPTSVEAYSLKKDQFEFTINNDLSVVEMKNPNSVFDFKSLTEVAKPLKIQIVTDLGAIDLFFNMTQEGPNKIVGINPIYGVNFEAFIKDNGRVHISMSSDKAYKYRLVFDAKAKKLDNGQIRHYSIMTKDVKTIEVGNDKEIDGNVNWVATDFNFHLLY